MTVMARAAAGPPSHAPGCAQEAEGPRNVGNRSSQRRTSRRQFLTGALRCAGAVLTTQLLGAVSCRRPRHDSAHVVVLGLDGLDPALVEKWAAAGHLPHMSRLIRSRPLRRLRTTWPPQSPTAWSTFITGHNPGWHGVFDMLVPDRETYRVVSGLTGMTAPRLALSLGERRVPLIGSSLALRRHGIPFWKALAEAGVPASLYGVPADFPATDCGALSLSGLGTTDLTGALGQYAYYTEVPPPDAQTGRVHIVAPQGGVVTARIYGPQDPWQRQGSALSCPFRAHISSDRLAVLIEVQGRRLLLRQGEWSEWLPIRFEQGPLLRSVPGMVRFYARRISPHLGLYVSPVNISPTEPAMPICAPGGFAARIARETGPFYTLGIPIEYGARMDNVFDDEDYLGQTELVWQDRLRLLDYACRHYDGGLLFFYIGLSDLNSHMFWRAQDPEHPAYSPELGRRFGDVILNTYRRLDTVVGRMLDELPPDGTLLVLSDHGFAPLRRYFCVNAWLRQKGLYVSNVSTGASTWSTQHVDWASTAAFHVGYNGLYLNRRGRWPRGFLDESQAIDLCSRIRDELSAVVDPQTGRRPVARVAEARQVYSGPQVQEAPDLVIGFNAGYGVSMQAILGGMAERMLEDNLDCWSGTHLIAPGLVPGTLMSSRRIEAADPGLEDIGPSVCAAFGVGPGDMEGRDLLADG